MALRAMVPVLVIVDVWSVLVVKVMVVVAAVAVQVPLATASLPLVVPLEPTAPAVEGRVRATHSRTAAVATALRAWDRRYFMMAPGWSYWLVAMPARCCSVKVYVSVVDRP
jgi:hypothetical protein